MIRTEPWYRESGWDVGPQRGLQEYKKLRDDQSLNRIVRDFGQRSDPAAQGIVDALGSWVREDNYPTKYGDKVMGGLSRRLSQYPDVPLDYIVYHPTAWVKNLPQVILETWVTRQGRVRKVKSERVDLKTFLRENYKLRSGDLLWDDVEGGLYTAENESLFDEWPEDEPYDPTHEEEYIVRAPSPEKKQQLFDWWQGI